jgi:hypothetical protein
VLKVCEAEDLDEVAGAIPHQHPLVAALEAQSGGDLFLAGDSSMMMYPIDLRGLFGALLPELQSRIDASGGGATELQLNLRVGDEACALSVDGGGKLTLGEPAAEAAEISLAAGPFCRVLLGESGWRDLEPALRTEGARVSAEESNLLAGLFPRRQVIFWAPDHY